MEKVEWEPPKARLWGWLLGGIVGGLSGLFPGTACCVGFGLGGVLGTLVAWAMLGDMRILDGVKVGIVAGIVGPLPGALLSIWFVKWVTTLPTYQPASPPDIQATGLTMIYVMLIFSSIMGIVLSVIGSVAAVFLINHKEKRD